MIIGILALWNVGKSSWLKGRLFMAMQSLYIFIIHKLFCFNKLSKNLCFVFFHASFLVVVSCLIGFFLWNEHVLCYSFVMFLIITFESNPLQHPKSSNSDSFSFKSNCRLCWVFSILAILAFNNLASSLSESSSF